MVAPMLIALEARSARFNCTPRVNASCIFLRSQRLFRIVRVTSKDNMVTVAPSHPSQETCGGG